MTWTADSKKREARNDHGYKITWSDNKFGTWFNGYSPGGTSISAGYDKEKVKAECEAHRDRLGKQRAMYAAAQAAIEVA
jgi:hypothetical protein